MFILFLVLQAFALPELHSTLPGTRLGNAHLVSQGAGSVYRGAQPLGKEEELKKLGITNILIFKNQTRNEVDKQIANLLALGYRKDQIQHVPFKWKDIESQEKQCEMVVQSLQQLKVIYQSPGKAVYLHCTVGEDRTGLLAGLFRMLADGDSAEEVFATEMCDRGYEAGNSKKPFLVVKSIRSELTPLFLQLASLIESGDLDWNRMDVEVCDNLADVEVDAKQWTCN